MRRGKEGRVTPRLPCARCLPAPPLRVRCSALFCAVLLTRAQRNDDFPECLCCGSTRTKEHHFVQEWCRSAKTWSAESFCETCHSCARRGRGRGTGDAFVHLLTRLRCFLCSLTRRVVPRVCGPQLPDAGGPREIHVGENGGAERCVPGQANRRDAVRNAWLRCGRREPAAAGAVAAAAVGDTRHKLTDTRGC